MVQDTLHTTFGPELRIFSHYAAFQKGESACPAAAKVSEHDEAKQYRQHTTG